MSDDFNGFLCFMCFRRVKMLIFCLLLIALFFSQNTGSATELTYIVKKEGGRLVPSCIAEGNERYEGIAWTYPIPESGKLPIEEHRYLPAIENRYNCKFNYDELCSKVWSLKNWYVDTNSTRRYDFISDERWEDFPIIFVSNEAKEFKNRIEIPKIFKLGFSVRTSDEIELLICEGWDPMKYSCYYFNISNKEISLSRHLSMSQNNVDGSVIMDTYKVFSTISGDEWRNFEIAMDGKGRIYLKDINLNRTVIEQVDKLPLRAAYFFYRSKKPSLWKIHRNDFYYTKNDQISRLGPSLKIDSENLCVNLFVTSCDNCTINFFMIENGTRTLIEQTPLKKSGEWSLIRLSKHKVASDHINIFIQTTYKQNVEKKNGFWAIDDVRVCNKNEIKINVLKFFDNLREDHKDVSCQIVEKPNLRPLKKVYEVNGEYPTLESESDATSINLTWTAEKSHENIKYFVRYQGHDTCQEPSSNSKRLRSNGFIVTQSNHVFLKDLVPYTMYTVNFSSILHLNEVSRTISTNESSYISFEEMPSTITIDDITEKSAKVSWHKVDCEKAYGRILYTLKLIDETTKNVTFLGSQIENSKVLSDLHPNSNYTLSIATSRSMPTSQGKINGFITKMAFKTKPALALPPRNLEVYASSESSLSLRYNIPDEKEGHPVEVHITRCNALTLKKCKTRQAPVMPCRLFAGKYCLEVANLIPHQKQLIKISLKNEGTHTFGQEAKIDGLTEEQVPGRPTNITYKLDCEPSVEHCNLNLSWLHPYDQNGTITSFNIILNSSEDSRSEDELKQSPIKVYKIKNQNYLPKYTYQIERVPFSEKYNLYIQSVNDRYKSTFTTATVIHTADLGDLIDQSPTLVKTSEDSFEFALKPPVPGLLTNLTVLIQDFDEKKAVNKDISSQFELVDNLCHEFGETWISQSIKITKNVSKIIVGKMDPSGKSLKPNTKYCFTFLMDNEYGPKFHQNAYYETLTTLSHTEQANNGLNIIFILIPIIIILILGVIYLIWYLKKRKATRRSSARNYDRDEHAYETLPFEDTIVNNNMYDHLDHK